MLATATEPHVQVEACLLLTQRAILGARLRTGMMATPCSCSSRFASIGLLLAVREEMVAVCTGTGPEHVR